MSQRSFGVDNLIYQLVAFIGRIRRAILQYRHSPFLKLSPSSMIYENVQIDAHLSATIEVGEGASVQKGAELFAGSVGKIILSKGSYVGEYTQLSTNSTIQIGMHSLIGPHCQIGAVQYGDRNLGDQKKIIIDDDVWIGAGAKIANGIRVGRGAVIGAGAVVDHDVVPFAIMVGNPAKMIKMRA